MTRANAFIAITLSCACAAVMAKPAAKPEEKREIRITVDQTKQTGFISVEAKNAGLAKIIDQLSEKTGVRAHYSTLPEEPVNATCAGDALPPVLKCLLGADAKLIFRYPEGESAEKPGAKPEDMWVLGSSLVAQKGSGECLAEGKSAKHRKEEAEADSGFLKPKETEALVKDARDVDPAKKLNAVGQLAASAEPGDPNATRLFEEMLADQDPAIRAQAIYGASRMGGSNASAQLQQAMQDPDADVRRMAVDSIKPEESNIPLLKQALNDEDESIRGLAAIRLDMAANHGMTSGIEGQ